MNQDSGDMRRILSLPFWFVGSAARRLFLIFAFAPFIAAVTSASQDRSKPSAPPRTFVSRGETFQFEYPSSLVLCGKKSQRKDCATYIAICDETAEACVAYPRARYEGYNFEGAAFSVNEHPEADTENKCLASMPPPVQKELLNGVEFQSAHDSSAAAGHGLEEDSYRTLHDGKCYELNIRIATLSMGGYAPGTLKEFTAEDEKKVRAYLGKIKKTFEFLK